jgi:hypothetical protein
MSKSSKRFSSPEEFKRANNALTEYQRRHNLIRKDYELLLELTESHKNSQDKFDTLYRASIKGFLSLIESDIYGLNQIDSYKAYSDQDKFEQKFKKTFKQVCKTWNKESIIKEFLDREYVKIRTIKTKRDRLIHPKNKEDIISASTENFNELQIAFKSYTDMINSLMNGFFISIELNNLNGLKNLFGS